MRALAVFRRLLPFMLSFLRDRRRWLLFGRPRVTSEAMHRQRAQRLTRTVAELGPTYIKLAQMFASRADILPEPYLSEIGQLTDRVPPLPVGMITEVIERELETPVRETFERFDDVPLAAASLGQVHRATWRGRDVVVKVLRPGVEQLVEEDLAVAYRILLILNVLFPSHHTAAITTIVREFAKQIAEEMDFNEEARNAIAIRANFAADARVAVPEVVEELTRRRVLVLEFMEGTKVDQLQERIAIGDVSVERLLETLVEVYMKMMLVDGIFHADPHPGNLLVSPDGRLVLLDFGMVVRVEPETRRRVLGTVIAAVRQDVDGVIRGFYELGIIDPEVDRGTIRDAAQALMRIAFTHDTATNQIQRVVSEVMSTLYRWPVMLPSELVYFGRAATLVEGIGVRYIPEFNSLHFVTPIVERKKGELLTVVLGGTPTEALTDWVGELAVAARELRDLLRRADRDEMRVRLHPRDLMEMQQFMSRQTRRMLLAFFSGVMALIGSLLYIAHRNLYVLAASLFAAFLLFVFVFLLPQHLLSNPLRGRRALR